MRTLGRLTVKDLASIPDPPDDTRYELIDGELYVSTQPDWEHQDTTGAFVSALRVWNSQTRTGLVLPGPGVIFAEDQNVAPDVVWISRERHALAVTPGDGRLHGTPELIIEVLSPGRRNVERDRELKLDLYSRQGVAEYWLADWRQRTVQVFRRQDAALRLVATYEAGDTLTSPLLPGFSVSVGELFPV